jgi:hypothetical protein
MDSSIVRISCVSIFSAVILFQRGAHTKHSRRWAEPAGVHTCMGSYWLPSLFPKEFTLLKRASPGPVLPPTLCGKQKWLCREPLTSCHPTQTPLCHPSPPWTGQRSCSVQWWELFLEDSMERKWGGPWVLCGAESTTAVWHEKVLNNSVCNTVRVT